MRAVNNRDWTVIMRRVPRTAIIVDDLVVLASPRDVRLRVAARRALQIHALALGRRHVAAARVRQYVRRHCPIRAVINNA